MSHETDLREAVKQLGLDEKVEETLLDIESELREQYQEALTAAQARVEELETILRVRELRESHTGLFDVEREVRAYLHDVGFTALNVLDQDGLAALLTRAVAAGERRGIERAQDIAVETRLKAVRAEIKVLQGCIDRAIEASDNDGGSASDAIQDMLHILRGEWNERQDEGTD